MRRLSRHLLIASLIALHASVMLCGPCLHALPGWGHGDDAQAACDGKDVRAHAKAPHASDDCPVCNLLSLGQLPVDQTCELSAPRRECLTPLAPADIPPFSLSRLSSPRAPPSIPTTLA
jgi:hypothetical protein